MFVAKIGSTTNDCRERKMLSLFITSGSAPPNYVTDFLPVSNKTSALKEKLHKHNVFGDKHIVAYCEDKVNSYTTIFRSVKSKIPLFIRIFLMF